MKTIFKLKFLVTWLSILSFFFACSTQSPGQDPVKEKQGFIRMVNLLVTGKGKVNLWIDGKNIFPDGYDFSDITGGIGLKAGGHTVTVKRDGLSDGTTKINLSADETTTIIPFAERIPATDEEPAHWGIRILRLKQKEESHGRTATFVSVSSTEELKVELGIPGGTWDTVFVKRLETKVRPIKFPESYAPIRISGKNVSSIPIDEIGNYVVVIYDDPTGEIKSLNFHDLRYLTAD